jgi:hypothetical protein
MSDMTDRHLDSTIAYMKKRLVGKLYENYGTYHVDKHKCLMAEKLRRELFYMGRKDRKLYFNLFYDMKLDEKRYKTLFEKSKRHIFLGQFHELDLYCFADYRDKWQVKIIADDFLHASFGYSTLIGGEVNVEAKCRARYIFNICFEKEARRIV